MEKIIKAIIILMELKGYIWCDKCEDWVKEEDHDYFTHF